MFVALGSLMTFQACKDDTTDPNGGNTGTTKTCTLTSTTSSDGDNYDFTYTDGKVTKVVNTYGNETDTYVLTYSGDQLTQITNGTEVLKLMYTSGKLSRVEISDDGDLYMAYVVTMSGTKISQLEVYGIDAGTETLWERYTYTYTGNNCTKLLDAFDTDDDGTLDYEVTYNMTSFDSKKNPYYNTPMWLTELDNPTNFCENNVLLGNIVADMESVSFSATYSYNDQNLPTQAVQSLGGFGSTTVNLQYDCK